MSHQPLPFWSQERHITYVKERLYINIFVLILRAPCCGDDVALSVHCDITAGHGEHCSDGENRKQTGNVKPERAIKHCFLTLVLSYFIRAKPEVRCCESSQKNAFVIEVREVCVCV